MADELHSLGEELLDRHLVLQLLRGLSKKYDLMNALIKRAKPLPSFHVVQNNLELELDMETEINLAFPTAHLRGIFHCWPPTAEATLCLTASSAPPPL
jgi:hypothetical protein